MRLGLLLLLVAGCSSYQPKPLDPHVELEALRAVRVEIPAEGLDPGEAITVALANNPALRAFRRERQIAEGAVVSADALTNPELRLGVTQILGGGLGFGPSIRWFPGVPGEGAAKTARAEARLRQVTAEIEDRENRLAAEVRIAHAQVLMLEESLALFDASVLVQERIAGAIDDRLKACVSTQLDATLARLRRIEVEAERRELASDRDSARLELNALLGLPPDTPLRLRRGNIAPSGERRPEVLEEIALRERADLRACRELYEQAEQELRLAHLARVPWPRFLQAGPEDILAPVAGGLGLGTGLHLPIFDQNQGGIAQAQAVREQVRERFIALVHAARTEIHKAVLQVREKERRRSDFEERIEPEIRELEELVRGCLDAGEVDALRLLAVQEHALKLRRDAVRARFEVERAIVSLELATGTALSRGAVR